MILEENWEVYCRCWSSEENRVDDHGDDNEGGIGAVGASDGLWRWWLAAAVVEDVPFSFFDDSAIWWSFKEFQLVESKEEWKWWRLGFVGCDLFKNWGRYEGLKIMEKEARREECGCIVLLVYMSIYRRWRYVIDYKVW